MMPCTKGICGGAPVSLELKGDAVWLRHEGRSLAAATLCPKFVIAGHTLCNTCALGGINGNVASGKPVSVLFKPLELDGGGRLEVILQFQWSPNERILRKWARYRLTGTKAMPLLEEVVLDELDSSKGTSLTADQAIIQPPASYPVLFDGFFVGIEFPVASTRVGDGRVTLAHQPGIRLQPEKWYETRRAVYGIAKPGEEKEIFKRYIKAHCPGGLRRMFVWETWLSVPFAYTEKDQEELMEIIHDNLLVRPGVSLDACVLTAGWSDRKSIYQIDRARFPGGLDGIVSACKRWGCPPGFWISPCAVYPNLAVDTDWAKQQDYETLMWYNGHRVACIGGKRYQAELKQRVVEMFGKFGMTYAYFDGFAATCPETDHGHEPHLLSAEPIAEGLIDVFQAARAARPDAWLEATCFGGNASPWWLFYVNTVLGNYGDDLPWGRIPCPVYRESQTTGRDHANLQGCRYSLLPVALQEVFGGHYNHSTEPMVNDAVMGVMRGNMLYMIASNPRCFSQYAWAAFGDLIKWSRKNTKLFEETQPLLPRSWLGGKCPKFSYSAEMPREPYGYAHWSATEGIIALRNPWIVPTTYKLELGKETNLSPEANRMCAISLFPENRTYATGLKYGQSLEVPLRPYETLVLWIGKRPLLKRLPKASGALQSWVKVTRAHRTVSRLEFDAKEPVLGPNWMALTADAKSAIKLNAEAEISLDSPKGELLVLLEGKDQIVSPVCTTRVNGKESQQTISSSDTAFASTGHPKPDHWLFVRSPLSQGRNRVGIDLLTRTESPKISVWAWAKKDGAVEGSVYPNSLPQPEEVSLDSVEVVPAVDGNDPPLVIVKGPRPRLSVDGVFCDAIEPKSVDGALKKNDNLSGKPMTVAGRLFTRGLGTSTPARIGFALNGKYTAFQSYVGVDCGTVPHDKSKLVFEVWADGKKLWESNPMTRWNAPETASVDIRGAKSLELITRDVGKIAGNANWADWAEAQLIR